MNNLLETDIYLVLSVLMTVFILGGKISKIEKFCLADTDMERSFVIINKEKKTPGKYPRKAGMPSKEPLQ